MSPAAFQLVFDANDPLPPWLPAFGIGLVIGLLVTGAIASRRGSYWPLGLVFLIGWTAIYLAFVAVPHWRLGQAVREGRCELVAGRVERFVAEPEDGKGAAESFEVGGRRFTYRHFVLGAGYRRTVAHGGPPLAGREVRICAVGDVIGRLELR